MRVGVAATWLTLAAMVAYALLPDARVTSLPLYTGVIVVASAGALVVRALPWPRLFAHGWGMRFMYAWSILDILLITVAIAATGYENSALFVLYALTTLFFALSYPAPGQVLLLAFTTAAYLGVLLAGGPFGVGDAAVRTAILGVVAFLSSFLARELTREIRAHSEARTESDRRAKALAAVADAARSMSTLSSDRVLESVVGSATRLGFEGVALCLLERGPMTYRIVHPRGLPEDFVRRTHSARSGLVGAALRQRQTVPVEDHRILGRAYSDLYRMGFLCAVASPVWSAGKVEAVLVAASREKQQVSPQDVEALELLANQSGRALENARRFEQERQALRRLEELDRFKRDFIDMASHELRTPLTVIRGLGLTMARKWGTLDDETRMELLDRLNVNAQVLNDIVSSLLDFSRLEDRSQVRQERTHLAPMIQRIASRLEGQFREHHLALQLEPGLMVRVDPLLLERVIENLMLNASRHTPPGTNVTVSATADVAGAEVAVEDDGPGVSRKDLAHLGERFYRGGDPNDRPTRGAGLGLALAKEILSLHGATLQIASEEGGGARFSFRLPLVEEKQPASADPIA